ncbi:MAG: transposase [Lacunisphaera sp.]|nr:transposase [Lacunisphaera sp.]
MALGPDKGYRALRHGRHSHGGTEYFVTFCTDHRREGLASEAVAPGIIAEIQQMVTEYVWNMRRAVIMPDHVHLLSNSARN